MPTIQPPNKGSVAPARQWGEGYSQNYVCAACDHFVEVGNRLFPRFQPPVVETACQCGGLVICCTDCFVSLLAQP